MTSPEREDDRDRRGLLVLLVLAVLLVLLGILFGYLGFGSSRAEDTDRATAVRTRAPAIVRPSPAAVAIEGTGTSSGTAQTGLGTPLLASSEVLGEVAPGAPATLVLTLTNQAPRAVQVMTVSARITSVSTATSACSTSWYDVGSFTGPTILPGHGVATVRLPVTFFDSPTVNQDGCKGARYTYGYRVEAIQA
jgi:hypothetical protein